jgi:hypothetical protein
MVWVYACVCVCVYASILNDFNRPWEGERKQSVRNETVMDTAPHIKENLGILGSGRPAEVSKQETVQGVGKKEWKFWE